ncbi:MAG: ABC transporter ATP-binding protein [Nitrososphaerales archaeon]
MGKLLDVRELTVQYKTSGGSVTALDKVSLEIGENQLLAIVGESGCGKSTLGLSIMGLLPAGSSTASHGSIIYKDTNLLSLNQEQMRSYRGTEIAMIFQEPLTSLNPVFRVGDQIAEAVVLRELRQRGKKGAADVMQKVYKTDSHHLSRFPRIRSKLPSDIKSEIVKVLNLVRIADAEQVIERYPFELSGGMRQRVMIAMALSQEPALLIADEPTTALDVTTQAQVLKLMRELMDKISASIILVTHDLAVASQVADRVVVMYAGEVVEDAELHDLFGQPLHPYTKGLLSCVPSGTKDDSELKPISGSIPDLKELPTGCRFAPRCPYAFGRCRSNLPRLQQTKDGHSVACFLYDN